jgi:hypothetical protein
MDFALAASACGASPAGRCNTADVTAHLPVLLLGLKWLYDTPQPPGAIQDPGGDTLISAGARVLTFVPSGPGGGGALRIDTTEPQNPITATELAAFADLLDGMGEDVVSISADAAGNLCALARPVHPTLRAAAARYPAGCVVPADASTVSLSDLRRSTRRAHHGTTRRKWFSARLLACAPNGAPRRSI